MATSQTSRLGSTPNESMKSPVVTITTGNITLSGNQTLNAVLTTTGDRVLVMAQDDATENGLYTASASAWSRTTDWNKSDDVVNGVIVLNTATSVLYSAAFTGTFVLDTTEVTFGILGFNANALIAGVTTGYPFTYSSTTVWKVTGYDATSYYTVGRRIKFTDGDEDTYYGIVNTVAMNGSDTDVTMTMEGGDVLTATITVVTVVPGVTAWTLNDTSTDFPNGVTAIHSGDIGGVVYWIIAGGGGELGYSTDKCETLTMVSTGTTVALNAIGYDSKYKEFTVVGNDGVVLTSDDGVTWTLDTTTVLAKAASGNAHIHDITWNIVEDEWVLLFDYTASNKQKLTRARITGGWTRINQNEVYTLIFALPIGATNRIFVSGPLEDILYYTSNNSTTGYGYIDTTGLNDVRCLEGFYDGSNMRLIIGRAGGQLTISTGTTPYTDDATFLKNVNGVAYSVTHGRAVAVMNDGEIGQIELANFEAVDSWEVVTNGFALASNVTAVHRNEADDMFVAGNSIGEIGRSTTGIN